MAGLGLALAAVWYVLRPVLRPDTAPPAEPTSDAGADPDDDLSARAVALRALKEIEFDRATGKLADADYESLKASYTTEALAAMRDEAGSEKREAALSSATPASRFPLPASTRESFRAPVCPDHGPRPQTDAEFCSDCGRRLALAPAFCSSCGAALERDARYCGSCGGRVAA